MGFDIQPELLALARNVEDGLGEVFRAIDSNARAWGEKLLWTFSKARVSEAAFRGSCGYGYGDMGREILDKVYSLAFDCESALVRHNFVSGTHALSVALFGVLRPGDVLLSVAGQPYDTLTQVIGIGEGEKLEGICAGSLRDFGVEYRQIDLTADGKLDFEAIKAQAKSAKVVYLQRSRGYSLRPAITIEEIKALNECVKAINPEAILMVDNCYGEFVENMEPSAVGADLIIGSLIKNPGGGLAETGGYIAGKKSLVELASYRLTAIGMGSEVGCTLNQTRYMLQGFFMAPEVTANALKTAAFARGLFRALGYRCLPEEGEKVSDIITVLVLENEKALCAFCKGIQKGAPVDSFLTPEPWDMPGYDSKVIMAAGAFTAGASIELSADGPIRPPYAAWIQGGLTFPTGRMGILLAAQEMLDSGLLQI